MGPGFLLLVFCLVWCTSAPAQQSSSSATALAVAGLPAAAPAAHAATQGTLTVTVIITSSVGLVTGPDGEQHVVLANAVDPADNVSRLDQHSAISPETRYKKLTAEIAEAAEKRIFTLRSLRPQR